MSTTHIEKTILLSWKTMNTKIIWQLNPPLPFPLTAICHIFAFAKPLVVGSRLQITADFGDDHPGISAITTHLS